MDHSPDGPGRIVETRTGAVRGTLSAGVEAYRGVPYGTADGEFGPLGEVRAVGKLEAILEYRHPGGLSATEEPPFRDHGAAIDEHPQSDQAFTVNIFAPTGADALPVLVFVHGGGFSSGGGSRWYDGSSLARTGNVVVVTVNYRLSLWGNLSAPGVPGNNAVRDVLAALHWISENIGAFGGDAGNVTLSGQSAGAAITRFLTMSVEAQGLFARAIMLSCPALISAPAKKWRMRRRRL